MQTFFYPVLPQQIPALEYYYRIVLELRTSKRN
ncbi:MAG: hypothetical protein ACI86H_000021 [bacterium]|jgi:hypothetical protein